MHLQDGKVRLGIYGSTIRGCVVGKVGIRRITGDSGSVHNQRVLSHVRINRSADEHGETTTRLQCAVGEGADPRGPVSSAIHAVYRVLNHSRDNVRQLNVKSVTRTGVGYDYGIGASLPSYRRIRFTNLGDGKIR